jgi:hypothetical protein
MKNIKISFSTKSRLILLISSVFFLSFSFNNLHAQEAVASSGSDCNGTGGYSSFTVGQVVFNNYSASDGYIDEGVQHPYEIYVITQIDNTTNNQIDVSAYPNPTTDYLRLDVKECKLSNLHFQLYDMHGKLLQSEKITSNQTSIVMSNLAPATYFVKVISGNQSIKEFKIIKNQ